MKSYNKDNSNKLLCYSMMGLVALIAFGMFATLPLLKGDEAWLSVPVLVAAAFFIGFIQNRCSASEDLS